MICAILIFQPQVLLLPSQCLFFLRKNDAYASFNLSFSKSTRSSWVTRRKDSFHCTSLKGRKQEAGKRYRKYQWLAYFPPILSVWWDSFSLLDMTKSFFTSPSLLYLPLWEMQWHSFSFPKQLLRNWINESCLRQCKARG